MESGIYIILNTKNLKRYIGSSKNIDSRLIGHKKSLDAKNHHSILLQRAWNKHGEENFKFDTLEYCENKKLFVREQYWMDYFQSYIPENGYNISPTAGSPLGVKYSQEILEKMRLRSLGRKLTEETKKRISLAKKGKTWVMSEEGRKNLSLATKGKKKPLRSEEHRKNLGMSLRGKKRTEAQRKKISLANTGKKNKACSEERKKKISLANTGKKRTEESRLKIRNSRLGKKHTEETKNKIRLSMKGKESWCKGKKWSEEQKINVKIAIKNWWDKRKHLKNEVIL